MCVQGKNDGKKTDCPEGATIAITAYVRCFRIGGKQYNTKKMSHFPEIAEAVSPGPFPPKCVYTRRPGSWSSLTRRRVRKYDKKKKKIKKTNARSYNTTTLLCVHSGKAPSHCNINVRRRRRVYILLLHSQAQSVRGEFIDVRF